MTAIAVLSGPADPQGNGAALVQALANCGVTAQAVPWRTLGTDWRRYDAALVATAGDGLTDAEAFLAVLAGIEASGCRLINAYPAIRWNGDPACYRELADLGLDVVPSLHCALLESDDLQALCTDSETDGLLVRTSPALGVDRCRVIRRPQVPLGNDGHPTPQADHWFQSAPRALLQEGLWTFVFLRDELILAVLRRAAVGANGALALGTPEATAEPDFADLEQAARVIATMPHRSVYTRVDMVRQFDGNLALLDLDLIAPDLLLSESGEIAASLAAVVSDALQSDRGVFSDPHASTASL